MYCLRSGLIKTSLKQKCGLRLVTNAASAFTPVSKSGGSERELKADATISNDDRLKHLNLKLETLVRNFKRSEKKSELRFNFLEKKLDLVLRRLLVFEPAIASLLDTNKTAISNTTVPVTVGHDSLHETTVISRAIESTPGGISLTVPGCVPIDPKQLRQFITLVIMLNHLQPRRYYSYEYIARQALGDSHEEELNGYRRNFVDWLAYLCDCNDKLGVTTTAIGLEQTPTGLILHIARNEDSLSPKLKKFLDDTIERLRNINEANFNQTAQSILSDAISIATTGDEPRLKECATHLVRDVEKYSRNYSEAFQALSEPIRLGLHAICVHAKENVWGALVDECYRTRDGSTNMLATIPRPARNIMRRIFGLVNRVGGYRHAAKTICIATKVLNGEKNSGSFLARSNTVDIKIHRSSQVLCRVNFEDSTLREIIAAIFRDEKNEMVPPKLSVSSDPRGPGLCLNKKFNKKSKEEETHQNRVHAELILFDYFQRENLEFVGNDRYIGCSKKACYSCVQYIRAMNDINQRYGRPIFVMPASTGSRIPRSWRPPDILEDSNNKKERCAARSEALDLMIAEYKALFQMRIKEMGETPSAPVLRNKGGTALIVRPNLILDMVHVPGK